MKNSIQNFREFALSQREMKTIIGGTWASYCSYDCYYDGSGKSSYSKHGWFGGLPSDWEYTRVPGTSASSGLMCMIMDCTFKKMA